MPIVDLARPVAERADQLASRAGRARASRARRRVDLAEAGVHRILGRAGLDGEHAAEAVADEAR